MTWRLFTLGFALSVAAGVFAAVLFALETT